MPFPLYSQRLILRHFRDSDVESFFAYRNDPEVARYQGWEYPYPREKAAAFVSEMKNAIPGAVGEWFQAAVECQDGGKMLGDVAFHIMKSDARQAYLGYSFDRAHWGKGYASEAVKCLLDFLFGELGLHRVVAECDVENATSWRLLERLGFRREAHLIENVWYKGEYGSEYHYAMLRREWEEHK